MAEPIYLNGLLRNEETNNIIYKVFYTYDWNKPYIWATENRLTLIGLNIITSTMDIKAAYARNSYRMNFKDKELNITENFYVFTDSWSDCSRLIDAQEMKGYTINNLSRLDQELIDLVN